MFHFNHRIPLLVFSCVLNFSTVYPYTVIQDQSTLEIKTPQLSERKTSKIQLKNGIKALLISDPKISQSAIAISVPAGSWNDPDQYPGMAHFCEHMLFMGTKKYPNEDDFFRFVSDHGGTANAYTAGDHTVYMFSSNNDSFIAGMDRISHFFIDPLFPASSVARELNAVDQENDKNIQNDGWRKWMIIKETGNQNHPNAKFATGTAATLGKIPLETLKEWYETFYSSEGMVIVAISNENLDTLAKNVEEKFMQVPKRKLATQIKKELTSKEQQGHLIVVEPIHDLRLLNLTWEIADSSSADHSDELIAAIIQSKHAGSLFDVLSKEELANSLSASVDRISLHNKFFEISISLTEIGVKHVDQVIEKIFQYLQLLKQNNVPISFQKELKSMNVLGYEYQTQMPAFDFVIDQIEELLIQPLNIYPDHSYILENYQPELVKKVLNQLKPENCIYFLVAKPEISNIEAERQEKWLGGKYSIKTIPQKQLDALDHIAVNAELKLPDPNPLIPQNLELTAKAKDKKIDLLVKEPIGTLYYEQDTQFLVPQVAIKLGIRSLLSDQDPKNFAFFDLLSLCFHQKMAASISQANFAGLSADMSREGVGIKLEIEGFSDKGKILWHNLLEGLKNLNLTTEEFDQFKTQLMIHYQNELISAPYVQSFQKINYLTRNDKPLPDMLEKGLNAISLKEFNHLKELFLENAYFEMFCFGNLSQQDSIDYFETVTDTLGSQPILPDLIVHSKALDMSGTHAFRINSTTDLMGNAALLMVQNQYQGPKAKADFLVINQAIKTAFFDTLRTKQQTGYITTSRAIDQLGFLQMYFIVQSTTHEPDELVARFELFLEEYLRNIKEEITKERFATIKEELKKDLQKPIETISLYASKRYQEAFHQGGKFDEQLKVIAALDSLEYESFLQSAQSFLGRSNDRRIAICISGEDKNNKSLRYISISDAAFKAEQSYVSYSEELK